MGESKPFSICGSLPLVGDLQKAGFDVQVQPLPMVLVLEEGEQCHWCRHTMTPLDLEYVAKYTVVRA